MHHGLTRVAGEIVRLTNASERKRWRMIREDYTECRSNFERIAECAPEGNSSKTAWMISSMSTVWGVKLEGLLSLALRFSNFSPVAVYLNHDAWSPRYHSIFKLRESRYFTPLLQHGPIAVPLEVAHFIRSLPSITDLLRFEFQGVAIGRIVLSNYLSRYKFARFDIDDPASLRELEIDLARSRETVIAARKLVEKSRPKVALLLEKGLSPMAELFGVCVESGVPVVQYSGSQATNSFVLKRYSMANRYQHPFSLDLSTWERVKTMPWSEERESELMQEFATSYQQGTWFNRKFLHQGKQIKSTEDVRRQLGLDPARKTAVIFSHVLWDATFFYGEGLFDNYESWLLETVRVACESRNINWVIKLHPDLVWKLKYEGYSGELRDIIAIRSSVGALPDHVKLVPPDTDISSYSFFAITDYCVTVRGTIGIEMACHGVPVLTAGTGRYSGLGFTIDSVSKQEYLKRIAHIQSLPAMSNEEITLARRFAYALFKLRLWPARSFEIVKSPLEKLGLPIDDNVDVHLSSYEQLAAASDLREFAEWVDSDAVDYFRDEASR
jgi:hypothetical protein